MGIRKSEQKADQLIIAVHPPSQRRVMQKVSVVVPARIATPHDVKGTLSIRNGFVSRTTSPPDLSVPLGLVRLATIYVRNLTIRILDQFGDDLGTVYDGGEIFEKYSNESSFGTINQRLSNGRYIDPVGSGSPYKLVRENDLKAIQQWQNDSTRLPMPIGEDVQQFFVQIDKKFTVEPQIDRIIFLQSPNIITVVWPDQ